MLQLCNLVHRALDLHCSIHFDSISSRDILVVKNKPLNSHTMHLGPLDNMDLQSAGASPHNQLLAQTQAASEAGTRASPARCRKTGPTTQGRL